ncbi:MAG: helix-turn-helix domain-containing protein [Cytophagales bacterium]
MKTFLKNLGTQIRILRAAKGLTQSNVASEIKITASAFAKIERGESDISISRIEAIANVFGLNASQLINQADLLYKPNATSLSKNYNELERIQNEVDRLSKMVESLTERVGKIEQ